MTLSEYDRERYLTRKEHIEDSILYLKDIVKRMTFELINHPLSDTYDYRHDEIDKFNRLIRTYEEELAQIKVELLGGG